MLRTESELLRAGAQYDRRSATGAEFVPKCQTNDSAPLLWPLYGVGSVHIGRGKP